MTFTEYQNFSVNIRRRAEQMAQAIRQRAIKISAEHLGPRDGSCFLMAHNWKGQSWMTPAQNQAARHILHLEEQSWEPGRMAARIVHRAWQRVRPAI